ncbi:hypothetical protein [Pseudomonas sp. CCI3.1]|uniref:hypothetical protein n=1 Tax=Pseudomonas sp. CCI3.1 TaxID=3048618 RepID=UPI002AB3DCBA|nr:MULTISPECIES: hypothetical protein [unclassified Pseudomonas]MDY7584945.1 hypothetical protein [Pseudomonas sp. CCI3.1]MEB0066336.1 hypothetical protein [Pseudomonas sp. CCI3.1]MEB0071654.1 hypothetical protein [Pseudomonas sp. CCI1.4]
MATVQFIRKDGVGKLLIDGVDVSSVTRELKVSCLGGDIPSVEIGVLAYGQNDVVLDEAHIVVSGIQIPESVEAALYSYLKRKRDLVDVTALSDSSMKSAIKS